jgi:protein FrlC
MLMKYAFNTWAYGSFPTWLPSYTLDETIRRLARIGYDGIEIGCAAPHAWPAYLSAARRKEIRKLAEGEGAPVTSLLPAPGGGPGCNVASPDPAERDFARKHYCEVIDLAADLGARTVLYVAGWYIFGTTRKQGWTWSADTLRHVAKHAAEKGVTIAVEPTPADSNLIERIDDAIELADETGAPNVKVMFDTFHSMYRNEVAADYVRVAGKRLANVHCADVGRGPPAPGPIDWQGLLQALKDSGYDGYVTMEYGFASRAADPDDQARRGLEYLKRVEAGLT